jgi:hypothetical protein
LAAGAAHRIARASGQAGQADFEQQLGEAHRAAAQVSAASVSAPPEPFHPDPREQTADELMGALPRILSREVLANGLPDTGQLRAIKRPRILNDPQHAATERQPSEIGDAGARVLMQSPTHQVGTSERARRVMLGDEHEYTPAPHPGDGGSMPSALQPDRAILVPDGFRKRHPAYFNDATAIEGLRTTMRAGKYTEREVTIRVNSLFAFSRWLLANDRPGFAARLNDPSLEKDLKEFACTGSSSNLAGALRLLRKSMGGAAPLVPRPHLAPYPDDAALIGNYKAVLNNEYQAAPATGLSPETFRYRASVLRHFSHSLRQANKPGIAGRIDDISLDRDVKSYKASVSDYIGPRIGPALAHLRKHLRRLAIGGETAPAAHPEDAVARRVGDLRQAAAPARPEWLRDTPRNWLTLGPSDDA